MRLVGADLASALYSCAFSLYFYASAHNSYAFSLYFYASAHNSYAFSLYFYASVHNSYAFSLYFYASVLNHGKTHRNKGQTRGLPLRFFYFILSPKFLNFHLSLITIISNK
jgi:hypothetical protein